MGITAFTVAPRCAAAVLDAPRSEAGCDDQAGGPVSLGECVVTDQRMKQIRFTAEGILDGKEWKIHAQDALDLIGELERLRGLCNQMQDERARLLDLLLDARVIEGQLADSKPVSNLAEHWSGIDSVLTR
jgi:hypothetical protein